MIELNCRNEESKKILELGYDFTSICSNFELHEKRKITKFVLVERHDDGLVSLWDCNEHGAYIYSTKCWWITPIIPKAALEACLPDINPLDDERLPNLDTRRLKVSKYHIDMCDREHEETIKQFNSAFEAFLWLHEHYPEELKKKFDEVMA